MSSATSDALCSPVRFLVFFPLKFPNHTPTENCCVYPMVSKSLEEAEVPVLKATLGRSLTDSQYAPSVVRGTSLRISLMR